MNDLKKLLTVLDHEIGLPNKVSSDPHGTSLSHERRVGAKGG